MDSPSFQKEPSLVRNLRGEADFFGLEEMSNILKATKTFSPELGDQGVLHWLGTNEGTTSYQNPFKIGAIHVEQRHAAIKYPRILILFLLCYFLRLRTCDV